ncbi:MAG: polysaccharide biosynthesis tyrosine autokinase [Chloroherpetonaceae bacterium]|nr:polysaccharide biosynthesis tyrosine autokinase [Chloroherpetonaceae bacterium]
MDRTTSNGYRMPNETPLNYKQLQQMLQEDESNADVFYAYLRAFAKGKWIILTVFLTSVFAGYLINRAQPDIYEGVTTVLVNNNRSTASVVISLDLSQRESNVDDIEILKSRTVSEEVAYKLLQTVYKNPAEKRDTLDIILNAERKIASVDEIAGRVRMGMFVQPSKVPGSNIIAIGFRALNPEDAATVSRAIAEVFQERKRRSANNAARVLRQFIEDQLAQKKRQLAESERALQTFMEQNRVVALNEEATRMIQRHSQAIAQMDEATVMLNALNASLKAYNEELAALQPKLSNSAVQATIDPYAKQFQAEIARLEFERDRALADPGTQYNLSAQERVKQYEDQIEAYKKKLQQAYDRQVKQGLANTNNTEYFRELYKKKLETELQIVAVQTRLKAYKELAEEYDKAFLKTPGKNIEFARLQRNNKTLEELFSLLEKRYQEALIAEEQVPSGVEIIDWAIPNPFPVGPNRKVNIILSIVVGLTLGIGVVMLIQFLDKNIHTPEQAEKLGSLLATIPVIETFDDTVRDKSGTSVKVIEGPEAEYKKIASHLVTHLDPKSAVSEAYRSLRTAILFSSSYNAKENGSAGKVYVITSSSPKEGKSTTISNLAITLAQGGQKTLLIDADLRRPVIHSIFGYSKEPGLTNYLVGRSKIEEVLRTAPVPNLSIITSGTIPPNPSELLGAPRMKDFLADMKAQFDIILFDSPPVLAVTDAQVLSQHADGVVVILAAGQTQFELAKRTKQALMKVDAPILGYVLNNFDLNKAYGSYYKYYRYYNYYYESKGASRKKNLFEVISDRLSGVKS